VRNNRAILFLLVRDVVIFIDLALAVVEIHLSMAERRPQKATQNTKGAAIK